MSGTDADLAMPLKPRVFSLDEQTALRGCFRSSETTLIDANDSLTVQSGGFPRNKLEEVLKDPLRSML